MKASQVGYGELINDKLTGINNSFNLHLARKIPAHSIGEVTDRTRIHTQFILANEIHGIKLDMHPSIH